MFAVRRGCQTECVKALFFVVVRNPFRRVTAISVACSEFQMIINRSINQSRQVLALRGLRCDPFERRPKVFCYFMWRGGCVLENVLLASVKPRGPSSKKLFVCLFVCVCVCACLCVKQRLRRTQFLSESVMHLLSGCSARNRPNNTCCSLR